MSRIAAPVGTGHHRDALRQHRDRLLARGIEQPFLGELLLELLERELQRAEAGRLRRDRVELELALLLVDRQPAAHDELQAVLDAEAEEARVRGEEHDPDLRARVLQREVEMPRRGAHEVRHLAFDGDVVVAIEVEIDLADQLGDGERPRLAHRRNDVTRSSPAGFE